MKYSIVALLLLAACVTAPKGMSDDRPVQWPAAQEFCIRHTNAAKTDPLYIADICVIECEIRPTQSWCEDLNEILENEQRTTSTDTN